LNRPIFALLCCALSLPLLFADVEAAPTAPQPLYRDPVFDGAADPVVIWNPHQQSWWMFYTNRRANVPGLSGVAWVHGTRVSIAESTDHGVTWRRVGDAEIELPHEIGGADPTHWAPDVITAPDGSHHMFLTVVPGIFENWQHPRRIVHLTSRDLLHWDYQAALDLASDRVIDAGVAQLPSGSWRMWYNNERDGKSTYYADSPDLFTWTDQGKARDVGIRPGEGPCVFSWRETWWMLVDHWNGIGVYQSDDLINWTAQAGDLVAKPGTGPDDGVNGGHPGVVVAADRAYLFYFTHPGRAGTISPQDGDNLDLRRSSIQVTELFLDANHHLVTDRNAPTAIDLVPTAPADPVAALPNPLIKQRADPHILRHSDGHYYFMGTVPAYDRLELRRAPTLAELATAPAQTIWTKHPTGPMGAHIWAPEIHFLDGKWYVYFAAGEAEKVWNIRIYVLENASANPLEGEWIERGQLDTGWESFALDSTVFEHRGTRYLLWAQQHPDIKGNTNLNIAPMASPTALAGPAVMLSHPEYAWEKVRYWVNEGPVILRGPQHLFLTYSAAGTGPEYCLGMLTADLDADLLDPASWTKSPHPVFQSSPAHQIYGPGHHSFTQTADGTTDLIVYHARDYAEITGNPLRDPNRHTRVQAVTWRSDGTPDFGVPRANTPDP
jgi:GH43 family beta-xylosidase